MLLEDVSHLLPKDWHPMDLYSRRYGIFEVTRSSHEYLDVEYRILGDYYLSILGIYKVQNPHLYTKFLLKSYEYEQRGPYKILSLFHDTPSDNIESIAAYNIDWRHGQRFMFGPGVYFSVSPTLANKHSGRSSSQVRSMFVCDVLVQNVQRVNGHIFLPDQGYDTVLAHNDVTYVKYFDCEYYPKYFVNYCKSF